jgi:hypothetical protein
MPRKTLHPRDPAVCDYCTGETCTAIAKDFGVSLYTIFDLKRGRSWKHVEAAT